VNSSQKIQPLGGFISPGWSIAANPKDSSEIQYDTKDMVKY